MIRLLTVMYLITVCACTYKKESVVIKCDTPDTVSFSAHVIPLFTSHCSLSGCHSGSSPEGNLNLEASVAYTNVTNPVSGYIDVRNPSFSLLYSSMRSSTDPMPPDGNLDDCKLEIILRWIEQGAANN